uniref:Uncharacterized protein n=1 Tax=Globisporangium ultimum (strain ATCC 200006 / CBS 805.95 / DAOM BR144) TaxID=431595 RepID=K3W9K9_GLOUD
MILASDDSDTCFLQELDALLRDVELPEELCAAPASTHVEPIASTPREPQAVPMKLAPPTPPSTKPESARPQVSPSLMKSAMAELVKPSKQRKKTSSQRQKEELDYLRSKVQELEQQLTTLKMNIVPHAPNSSDSEDGSDRSTTAVSVWEHLAKRELKKRDRAKFENAQLREMLESQIKVAKSLERILGKRQVWDELQQNKRHCMAPSTSTKSEVFAMLSKSVDARLPLIHHVLESHGLTSVNDHLSKASVAHSAKNGLSINFVDVSIMPFDLRSTANTIWKHMRLNTFDLPNCTVTTQIMEQTDTMLAMTQVMTIGAPSETRSTTIHSVSKRVMQDNQVIMVWETVSETALPLSGKPKVEMIQQGWVKLLHAPASDGSAASMIQSSPTMNSDGADDSALLELVFHDLDTLLLELEPPCIEGTLPLGALDALVSDTLVSDTLVSDAASLEQETSTAIGDAEREQLQWSPDELMRADATPSHRVHGLVNAAEPVTKAMITSELPRKSEKRIQILCRAQPMTTSQRQKKELTYLRTKLVQLEDELNRLQAKKNSFVHGVRGEETESSSTPRNAGDFAWRPVAESQRKDAIRAKLENAELREQLEEQVRFAKSLQQLLRKRKIWDELEEQKRYCAISMSGKDADIFEALSKNVDFNFTRLDRELEAHGLSGKCTATSSANVAYNAEEGLHINFVELIIMPFELRAIADLAWKTIATKDIKVQNLLLRGMHFVA